MPTDFNSLKFQAPDYRPKKYRVDPLPPRSTPLPQRPMCEKCHSRVCLHQDGGSQRLGPRLAQVARLICNGLLNKEIGYILGVTEGTVKQYINIIMRRTKTVTRTEVAAWYWLRPEEFKPTSYYREPGLSNTGKALTR